jgi:hypothetical protein
MVVSAFCLAQWLAEAKSQLPACSVLHVVELALCAIALNSFFTDQFRCFFEAAEIELACSRASLELWWRALA